MKKSLIYLQLLAMLLLITACGHKLKNQPVVSSNEEGYSHEKEQEEKQEQVTIEAPQSSLPTETSTTSELEITEGTDLMKKADANAESWLRVIFPRNHSQNIVFRDDGSECFLAPTDNNERIINTYQLNESQSTWEVGIYTYEYDHGTRNLYRSNNNLQKIIKELIDEVQYVKTHNDKPVWVTWVDDIATFRSVNDEGEVIEIVTHDNFISDYLWFNEQLFILDQYTITRVFDNKSLSLSFENQSISGMTANDEYIFVILGNGMIYRVNVTPNSFNSEMINYINWHDDTAFVQNDILYSTAGYGATDLKMIDDQKNSVLEHGRTLCQRLELGETYQLTSSSHYYNIQHSTNTNRIFVLDNNLNQYLVELSPSLEEVGTIIPKSIREYVVIGEKIYYIPWGESTIYEFDLNTATEKVLIQSANNVFAQSDELYYETMAPEMNLVHYVMKEKKSELIWEGHVSNFVYYKGLYYIVTPEGAIYEYDINNGNKLVLEDNQIGYVGIHNEELIAIKNIDDNDDNPMIYKLDEDTKRLVLIDILFGDTLLNLMSYNDMLVSVRGDMDGYYIEKIDPSNHFTSLLNEAYVYNGKYYLYMEIYEYGVFYCYDPSTNNAEIVDIPLMKGCNQMLGIDEHLYLANDIFDEFVADFNIDTGEFLYIVEPHEQPANRDDSIEIRIEDGKLRYD